METPTVFEDWELLHESDSMANPKPFEAPDDDSEDGAIKSEYFSLNSMKPHPRTTLSEEDNEEGSVDSDNPSWVDPDSDSRYLDRSRGQLGFQGIGFPIKNSGGFWSDESSDGQRSLSDSERGEVGKVGDLIMEVGSEGIEAGGDNSSMKDLGFGEIGGSEGVEMGKEDKKELGSGELVNKGDGSDPPVENPCLGEGGNGEKVWWKMPLELLKFCLFRVRPVWSISIAAVIMGVVMLGRRLYKMKQKSRSIPLKIAIDDKKASQFMARAARLNEAFSVVKRVPIIRPSLPAGGITSWPVDSIR